MLEAVHLGDLLRIWVRPGARFTPSPQRFPRLGHLSRGEPIPGHPPLHKEKRTLPGAPAGFTGIGRVTTLDASRRQSPSLPIRGCEPDSLPNGICTRGGSTRAHALGFCAHRGGSRGPGMGPTLQRHPFSGLVDSAAPVLLTKSGPLGGSHSTPQLQASELGFLPI
ncbi:hypothetical protein SKAU_G00089140 [Synaphobranchus kaupii]|uniref:Uncharacterized protein n=1 Tax=Synaphobranchus kaupii TaxID=118154 RepID=A0A9Q1FX86_SYNKA|nr:hypothetical protein SKAU_G00089140 [Synaphobranchus kaupii]